MHNDLGESNLGGQEINSFPYPERIRFCQSPYNSRIQTFERKAFGLAIDLPGFPSNFCRRSAAHHPLHQDAIAAYPVVRKRQVNVNLESTVPKLIAVFLPFKIPHR